MVLIERERERESAFFPGVCRPCDLDISVGSVCIGGDRVRAVALRVKVGISGPLRCFVF